MERVAPGMSKPLIGLPGRRKLGKQVDGFPDNLSELPIDLYLADYSSSVLAADGLPVLLPMDADPLEYVSHLHGIVLTGGVDIDPAAYGQDADGNGAYEPERDELELALLEGAFDEDLAVLGICRGLQIINVQAGGTLHQHVPEHARYDVAPDARVHEVSFEPESRLGLMYAGAAAASAGASGSVDSATGRSVSVNSLHHQVVDVLGGNLKVSARDSNGVVEGIEVPGRDIVAVQWHPEMLLEPEPVFTWLVAQARKRMAT